MIDVKEIRLPAANSEMQACQFSHFRKFKWVADSSMVQLLGRGMSNL